MLSQAQQYCRRPSSAVSGPAVLLQAKQDCGFLLLGGCRPLWPGRVDILIRSYFSTRLYLLSPLWRSIDLLWPKGIGAVVLVLDEGDAALGAEALVPAWVTVKYEQNYLRLPGKILQQWSYGWADNYTTAPFIAIMDDDVVLNLKVR